MPSPWRVETAAGSIHAAAPWTPPPVEKRVPQHQDAREIMRRRYERVCRMREGDPGHSQTSWADIAAVLGMNLDAHEMRATATSWGRKLGLTPPWEKKGARVPLWEKRKR